MALPETLLRAYEENSVYNGQGQKIPLQGAVLKEEAQLLYDVVRSARPQQSLELGIGCGMSAMAILAALEDNQMGHHIIFDYKPWELGDAGLTMIERAGLLDRMSFYPEKIEDGYHEIPDLDFAFIDASHLFDLTMMAFVLIDNKLSMGGLIGFHDTWLPAQQQVISYILKNRSYIVFNPRGKHVSRNRKTASAVKLRLLKMLVSIFPRNLCLRSNLHLPNLVILQKKAEDSRTWKDHVDFW